MMAACSPCSRPSTSSGDCRSLRDLGFGCPCIISSASALPQTVDTLAHYFDPENSTEADRVTQNAIEDRDATEVWNERVATEFRPVSWDASARAILKSIDHGRNRLPAGDATTREALPRRARGA